MAHQLNFDVFLKHSLLDAHLWPSSVLALNHIIVLISLNLFYFKFFFLFLSKCPTIGP
jgi:hypothetical protein